MTIATTGFQFAKAQAIGERSPLDLNAGQAAVDFRNEQPGVRAGVFELFPTAAVSAAYDSNIFALPAPRTESMFSIAEMQLRLENEQGAIDMGNNAFVRVRRFVDAHDQDTTEYGVSAEVGAHPNTQNELRVHVLAERRFESRIDIETPDTRQVSLYKDWQGEASYSHQFNRFAVRSTVSGRQLDYEEASERYRDIASYRGEVRGTYEFPDGVAVIGSGYYSEDDYRFSSPYVASAKTVGALAGVSLSIPEFVSFELTGGYFSRTFAQRLGEISGISLRGAMRWQPTRLTTIRVELAREDAPTRIVGAYGKIRTDVSVEVVHEYSRTINLYLRGRAVVDDFDTVQRTDRTYLSEMGFVYLLSRRYVVAAEYDYSSRNSAVSQEDFLRHVVSMSLLGRF